VARISWAIDQASRVLSVIASTSGTAIEVPYPQASDGNLNVPVSKLVVSIWLQNVGSDTVVYLDDLVVEEFPP
jgi:hypothetical protein